MKRLLPILFSKSIIYFLILISFAVITSCNGSKKMMKDAAVLEKGGLKQEALNKYSFIYEN